MFESQTNKLGATAQWMGGRSFEGFGNGNPLAEVSKAM